MPLRGRGREKEGERIGPANRKKLDIWEVRCNDTSVGAKKNLRFQDESVTNRGAMVAGRVWVEVDLDLLRENCRRVKAWVKDSKLLVAVKADAYGHGSVEVSRALLGCGVDMLGVASVDEGTELRRAGIDIPILVLSPAGLDEVGQALDDHLLTSVSDFEYVQCLSEEAQRRCVTATVHIEIDTGMGRTGVISQEAVQFVRQVTAVDDIEVEGIFTHFASAESDLDFSREQLARFRQVLEGLEHEGIQIPLRHAANSAAILGLEGSFFNMVRPGLIIYGLYPSPSVKRSVAVSPVMSMKSRVMHLNRIARGQSVSYGRTFRASRSSLVATVSVGYGDGYPRSLSNCGSVLIRGRRAPIVGVVCMDLTMVDVTDLPEVKLGDEVVLIGSSDGERVTADEVAAQAGTISYEITTSIGPRVPRVFLSNGRAVKVRSLLGNETCGGDDG